MDAVVMMRPPPCLTIWRAAIWQHRNTPVRLTRSTRCHWASGAQQRRRVGDARVGEHHVEPPELGDRAIDERLHLAGVADVHAHGEGPAPGLDDLPRDRLGRLRLHVAQHHRRALRREQPRRRAPDAERASGDRGDPSLQAHARCPYAGRRSPSAGAGTANALTTPEQHGRSSLPPPSARPATERRAAWPARRTPLGRPGWCG